MNLSRVNKTRKRDNHDLTARADLIEGAGFGRQLLFKTSGAGLTAKTKTTY
jgi:hypothetical protein